MGWVLSDAIGRLLKVSSVLIGWLIGLFVLYMFFICFCLSSMRHWLEAAFCQSELQRQAASRDCMHSSVRIKTDQVFT